MDTIIGIAIGAVITFGIVYWCIDGAYNFERWRENRKWLKEAEKELGKDK